MVTVQLLRDKRYISKRNNPRGGVYCNTLLPYLLPSQSHFILSSVYGTPPHKGKYTNYCPTSLKNTPNQASNAFGGYTEQEMRESNCDSAQTGRYEALLQVRAYMREINGEDSETRCDLAWKYVTRKIEELTTF